MLIVELNCCRICLETHNLKDIFADDGLPTISDKIMYCASVQISPEDPLPSKICTKCALYLDVAYVFRTVCEWTESKLRQENANKNEPATQTSSLVESSNLVEEGRAAVLLQLDQQEKSRAVNCGYKKAVIENCDLNLPQTLQKQTNICDIFLLCNNAVNKNCGHVSKEIAIEAIFANDEKNHSKEQSKTSFKLNSLDDKEEVAFADSVNNKCTKAHQMDSHNNSLINGRTNIKNLWTPEIMIKVKNKDPIYRKLCINCKLCKHLVDKLSSRLGLTSNFRSKSRICSSENNLAVEQSDYEWVTDYEKTLLPGTECLNIEENCSIANAENTITKVGRDLPLAVYNVKQHLEDELGLSLEGGYNEITVKQSNQEEKWLFNKDINKSCIKNENYHTENTKSVSGINTINREDKYNSFKEDNQTENKVVVERHTLLDEANNSVVKSIVFQCQTQDDYYSGNSILLNNKDPLLPNEKSGADLGNNSAEDTLNENLEMQFNDNVLGNKSIFLKNILLHDFENFEREKLSSIAELTCNAAFHNDTALGLCHKFSETRASFVQSESRVGRHIAKKNAGQPPKRFSRAILASPKRAVGQNLEQNINDYLPIAEKQINTEYVIDHELDLENTDSILDQQYILERDLSMPEPIFEETVVTDSFGTVVDNSQIFDDSCTEDRQNAREKQPKIGRLRKGNKVCRKASRKVKKHQVKAKIFSNAARAIHQTTITTNIGRTMTENKYNTRPNRKKTSKHDFYNRSDSQDEHKDYIPNDDNDLNYSSEEDCEKHQNTFSKRSHGIKQSSTKEDNIDTTCKICNKSFPFPSHLRRHLTAHIGVKRFSCKYCSKQFLHNYNLSVHVRSHTGDFPLKCSICSRGFASPSVLERHKRSHTGETPYQCRFCLQLFSHGSSLNMHEKMHLSRPSFTCDICFKVFSYKSSLTAHKKGHSGLKAHSCSICHKRFTRRTSVMRHMGCHADVKKFTCPACDDVFSSQSGLIKHRKMHSRARKQ